MLKGRHSRYYEYIPIILFSIYVIYNFELFFLEGNSTIYSDLESHIAFARKLFTSENVISYPLFHILLLLLSHIKHVNMAIASAIVLTAVNFLTMILTREILKNELNTHIKTYWIDLLSLSLCCLSAIWIPAFNKNIYLGQWSPNPWHNPTYLMMRPFSIIIFYLFVKMLNKDYDQVKPAEFIFLAITSAIG